MSSPRAWTLIFAAIAVTWVCIAAQRPSAWTFIPAGTWVGVALLYIWSEWR